MRKAFICPTKYVQGEDEILNLGYFVQTFGKSALLIAHKDDVARVSDKLNATAKIRRYFWKAHSAANAPEKRLQGFKKWPKIISAIVPSVLAAAKP